MSKIKWDEPTIKEHDKLRGTRMKIDEPDTPYEHYVMEDDAEGARFGLRYEYATQPHTTRTHTHRAATLSQIACSPTPTHPRTHPLLFSQRARGSSSAADQRDDGRSGGEQR